MLAKPSRDDTQAGSEPSTTTQQVGAYMQTQRWLLPCFHLGSPASDVVQYSCGTVHLLVFLLVLLHTTRTIVGGQMFCEFCLQSHMGACDAGTTRGTQAPSVGAGTCRLSGTAAASRSRVHCGGN